MLLPHIPCQLDLQEILECSRGSPPMTSAVASPFTSAVSAHLWSEFPTSCSSLSFPLLPCPLPSHLNKAASLLSLTVPASSDSGPLFLLFALPEMLFCQFPAWLLGHFLHVFTQKPFPGHAIICLSIPQLREIWVLMIIFQRSILPPPSVSTLALGKCPNVCEIR